MCALCAFVHYRYILMSKGIYLGIDIVLIDLRESVSLNTDSILLNTELGHWLHCFKLLSEILFFIFKNYSQFMLRSLCKMKFWVWYQFSSPLITEVLVWGVFKKFCNFDNVKNHNFFEHTSYWMTQVFDHVPVQGGPGVSMFFWWCCKILTI